MQNDSLSTKRIQPPIPDEQTGERPSGAYEPGSKPASSPAQAGAPAAARGFSIVESYRACEAVAATVNANLAKLLHAETMLGTYGKPELAAAVRAVLRAYGHNDCDRHLLALDIARVDGEVS